MGASLGWASSAALGKAVFTGTLLPGAATALTPLILAQTRVSLSLLALVPALMLARGARSLALPRADALRCIVLGVLGLAGSNFFYYYSISKTTVATAIIVQYTAPVWVLLYMVFMRQERVSARRVLAVTSAVAGCGLAIGLFGKAVVDLNWIGVGSSMVAAFSFAFYNVYGRHMIGQHSRWTVITWALGGTALFWLAVNPPWKIVAAHYTGQQWVCLAVIAIVPMLIPFPPYFAGLEHLGPTRAIVTSCLEPVFAIGIAAIFLKEGVSLLQGLGIVVVLAATVVIQMPEDHAALPEEHT